MLNLHGVEWLVLLVLLGVFVVAATTIVALIVWAIRRGQRPRIPTHSAPVER